MLTRADLHGYQVRAVEILTTQPKAYLALGMGLGKTVSTLTAISDLRQTGSKPHAICIAPKRVAESVWPFEASKWQHLKHLKVVLVAGTPKQREVLLAQPADLHVIGRDSAEWMVKHLQTAWPFDTLVIDEGDSFKNPGSKRFKMIKRIRALCDRAWILSGTPAPNGLLDLWPQYFILDGGQRLGRTMTSFKQAFFTADHMGWKWTINPGAEVEIHRRIADITVSMRAEDYLTLPDRIDNIIKVELTKEQRAIYKRMERDYLLEFSDTEITAANAAVLAGKLLQLSNGAVYDESRQHHVVHDQKLDALGDVIDGACGNPVMVMYCFKHDLARIKAKYPKARELNTSKDVDDWNAGKIPLLLAHPASCGHGLNLQGADGSCMVWFGLPWSLGLYQQACARIHRQGVKHAVVIHHLVTDGSIDEDVLAVLGDKAKGQERLLAAMRRRLANSPVAAFSQEG